MASGEGGVGEQTFQGIPTLGDFLLGTCSSATGSNTRAPQAAMTPFYRDERRTAMDFQERQGLQQHIGLRNRYGAWSDGHMGVGGGGDTDGLEGARSMLSSLGLCWAVEV